MCESGIWVSASEYAELTRNSMMLEMVMRALYVDASLSWNKEELSLDRSGINAFLKVADHDRYWKAHAMLMAEEKKKEEKKNEAV